MALPNGTLVVNRYRIQGILGRGGVATVYRARDVKFDVDVALKVATLTGQAFDEFKARFQREARIGHQLGRTAGLVRAIDWGELEQGETLYMALDLVADARPLDPCSGSRPERLAALARAASLVARVHAQGVVHRDVKPANFLVSPAGELHLTDFGEARNLRAPDGEQASNETRLTRTGATLGTPVFMAPEQFQDASRVDERADVYSLGVMLHLALTGAYPFDAPTTIQLMALLLQAKDGLAPLPPTPRERDPSIAPELDRVCLSAIALDPARRLASAEALARELSRLASGDAKAAAPKPTRPPPSRGELGLDADGFVTREKLRGKKGLRELLGELPALVVKDERAVEGKTTYQGRVAFLLPRGPGSREDVTVGRGEASDLSIRLVTMSTSHARFVRSPAGHWSLVDLGSTNGTWLNGQRLRPGVESRLAPGDRILFSEHLTLELVDPDGLCAELSSSR